jgi:ribonucleotide monophosphatase NagD (HAD superfamily)
MNKKETICIDFDGVIHQYSQGHYDGSIYDLPVEGAQEALKTLSKKYEVVILTSRNRFRFKEMREWMKRWGFDKYKITNRKLPAVAYIDDRAILFTNWNTNYEDIFRHRLNR